MTMRKVPPKTRRILGRSDEELLPFTSEIVGDGESESVNGEMILLLAEEVDCPKV